MFRSRRGARFWQVFESVCVVNVVLIDMEKELMNHATLAFVVVDGLDVFCPSDFVDRIFESGSY